MALVSPRRIVVHDAARASGRVVFLIILGLSSYGQPAVADEPAQPGQAPAKNATAAEGRLRPIVYLETPDSEGSDWKSERGLLPRELLRQAVLLAGRESLGLTTRDGCLRELLPEGTSDEHALRLTASDKGKTMDLAIMRGQGNRRKVVWTKEIAVTVAESVDLLPF